MSPRTSSSSSSSSSSATSSILSQQKLYRRSHPNEAIPNPAFLLTSKFLDVVCCSTPLFPSLCPFNDHESLSSSTAAAALRGVSGGANGGSVELNGGAGGGWRSYLPEEWVHFPTGQLSHSFGNFYQDGNLEEDLTFDEFYRDWQQKLLQQQAKLKEEELHKQKEQLSSKWSNLFTPTIATTVDNDSVLTQTSHLLSAYYTFAFQTNNTTLSTLTHPSTLVVLVVLVLLFRTMKKIFLPKFSSIGEQLGKVTHGAGWSENNQDRIQKFGEYVYRLLYHSAVSIYGVRYFHDKAWWKGGGSGSGGGGGGGTMHLWIGHPNQVVHPGMAWYYLLQCAYNVDALFSLCELSFEIEYINPFTYSSALDFLEREQVVNERQRKEQVYKLMASSAGEGARRRHRQSVLWTPLFRIVWSTNIRGDFREMMAHHIVTNALIFFSSYYRLTRVGSMVFLVHDLSDVPVDMSKLANFVKWKITTICCFVGMVVMWMITRLYIFPFVICRAVIVESYEYLVWKDGASLDPAMYNAYYLFFYALLGALVLLHLTWFLILLRIGWTLVSTGERHDYTEHKSGEKQKNN
ncbi:hypothetical protein ACHAWU_002729 [Discostella pseudostelligera]|uniref:TLC domain-containing protein n=1 Tax=Discostella pseudostelligera TaxID=259834 RepID=A0ABD3MQ25_9STRA